MIKLEVELELLPEKKTEFLNIFKSDFAPAISKQAGFTRVSLLKQRGGQSKYQMEIVFQSEAQRLAWVKTVEHEQSWLKLEALIGSHTAKGFDFIIEVPCQV